MESTVYMGGMNNHPTEAQESVRVAARAGIDQFEGRTVYARACAGFGLIFGVYFALVQGDWFGSSLWVSLGYVVLVFALTGWQTRAARSCPGALVPPAGGASQ